ncbi:hypothetical protein BB559_000328 [Furculomyces boomerangus]|uniref:2Fe-2S ferredoxin n=2 Tax=Harpellales TaxID=61421 RepID=A0A2T9Z5P6_9FUNG|nr:hypothetical protein BB559_000838 [Furculomyces boomerangus]PVU99871.1 hypothetical protein BB559_000328 [Furculomyces boomerangus]PWA03382.1 hypothetical protein BB558_000448 [Smittium angustum]
MFRFLNVANRSRGVFTTFINYNPTGFRFGNTITRQFSAARINKEKVNLVFVTPEKQEIPVEAEEGINLLELAHENDVDLEGACECSCACSTCHVILDEDLYEKLDEPSDEEMDMLDLAFGLTETSRLGCQIQVSKMMEGAKIRLPSATRNFYVDGAKPLHH